MDSERIRQFYDALYFDGIMAEHFEITERGDSYTVKGTPEAVAHLMFRSGSFRNAILSNNLVYYRGLLYSRDAFTFDENRVILSRDAKEHPEKYCLMRQKVKYGGSELYLNPEPMFDISPEARRHSSYFRGYGGINPAFVFAPGPNSNQISNHRKPGKIEWESSVFSIASDGRNNRFDRDAFEAYMDKVRDLPNDFGGALQAFITETHRSQEDIAFEANMSARNLSRLIKNKQQPKLETVVALCISLHLFPLFSEYLISLAGYSLRNTEEGLAYNLLINQFYMEDLIFCNKLLREIGIKPLTLDPFCEIK